MLVSYKSRGKIPSVDNSLNGGTPEPGMERYRRCLDVGTVYGGMDRAEGGGMERSDKSGVEG